MNRLEQESKRRRCADFSFEREPNRLAAIDERVKAEGDCVASQIIRNISPDNSAHLVEYKAGLIFSANNAICQMIADLDRDDPGIDLTLPEDGIKDLRPDIDWEATGDDAIFDAIRENNWRSGERSDRYKKTQIARRIIHNIAEFIAAEMKIPTSVVLSFDIPELDIECTLGEDFEHCMQDEGFAKIMEDYTSALEKSLKGVAEDRLSNTAKQKAIIDQFKKIETETNLIMKDAKARMLTRIDLDFTEERAKAVANEPNPPTKEYQKCPEAVAAEEHGEFNCSQADGLPGSTRPRRITLEDMKEKN